VIRSRDEAIENPYAFIIDCKRLRTHLSFGFVAAIPNRQDRSPTPAFSP
jgi:hypothetical protein